MMNNFKVISFGAVTAVVAFLLGWVLRPDFEETRQGAGAGRVMNHEGLSSRVGRPVSHSGEGGVETGVEGELGMRYLSGGEISAEDMRGAMGELLAVNDPLLRQKMLSFLLENLTAENAAEAFLALRDGGRGGPFGRRNDDELRLVSNAWGRINGEGAVTALEEMGETMVGARGGGRGRGRRGGVGGSAMVSALAGWAAVDGAGASAYFREIEGEWETHAGAYGVVQGMLVNGVGETMEFIGSLPETEEGARSKGRLMALVTEEVLEQGLESAKGWVHTVTDPALRTGVLTRVTMEMMNEGHAMAAEWIAQFSDEEAAVSAVDRLAGSWSREDPAAVLRWAEQLSAGSKLAAYDEALGRWAREDPVAAGEFLGTLGVSPERDAAVESYATRVSRQDPEGAMAWAETITDVELREGAREEVARDWYRNDPVAATAWIEASGFPEALVEEITSSSRNRGRKGRGR